MIRRDIFRFFPQVDIGIIYELIRGRGVVLPRRRLRGHCSYTLTTKTVQGAFVGVITNGRRHHRDVTSFNFHRYQRNKPGLICYHFVWVGLYLRLIRVTNRGVYTRFGLTTIHHRVARGCFGRNNFTTTIYTSRGGPISLFGKGTYVFGCFFVTRKFTWVQGVGRVLTKGAFKDRVRTSFFGLHVKGSGLYLGALCRLFLTFNNFSVFFPIPLPLLDSGTLGPLSFLRVIFMFFNGYLLLNLLFCGRFKVVSLVQARFFVFCFGNFVHCTVGGVSIIQSGSGHTKGEKGGTLRPFGKFCVGVVYELIGRGRVTF